MKFWKPVLLTAFSFLSIATIIVYSSCEKNPCNGVSCSNGGSCNNGVCKCPSGYEGPTCGTLTTARYAGVYAGFTQCNNGAYLIDTVWVTDKIYKFPTRVHVVQKSHIDDLLIGTVSSNESTYSVSIPNKVQDNWTKVYHMTLQSDSKLVLDIYEHDGRVDDDSIVNKCNFVGFKVPAGSL